MSIALTQTTLSGAVSKSANFLPVAANTGITAPVNNISQKIYVINPNTTKGELMTVVSVSGTQIGVSRLDEFRQGFISGAIVVIGVSPASPWVTSFHEFNPVGAVTAAEVEVTPWINAVTGEQWLRGTDGLWVSGWNNPTSIKGLTTDVASFAGFVLPTGPLFHMTGSAAVTGITIPVGFSGGSFTTINDAAWTWTKTNNLGDAGTAVALETTTFTWDSKLGLFYAIQLAA